MKQLPCHGGAADAAQCNATTYRLVDPTATEAAAGFRDLPLYLENTTAMPPAARRGGAGAPWSSTPHTGTPSSGPIPPADSKTATRPGGR